MPPPGHVQPADEAVGPIPEEWSPNHILTTVETRNNPPMYGAVKYFGGKPSHVWSQYIEAYSQPGEVILDPFCGQGIAVGEAVRLGRRAVGFDLQPSATFFTSQIFNKVDEQVLLAALQELQESIGNDIDNLYVTRNRSFGVDMDYAVLSNTQVKELLEERGLKKSGDGQEIRARLTEFDAAEGDVARYELIPTAGLARLLRRLGLEVGGDRDSRIKRLIENEYVHPEPFAYSEEVTAICFIACGGQKNEEELTHVRYYNGATNVSVEVEENDRALLNTIRDNQVFFNDDQTFRYPYPDDELEYSNGTGFMKRENNRRLSDWYTDRNLAALAALRHHILQIDDEHVRNAFMHAFIAILWQTSRTPPDRLEHDRGYSATMPLMSLHVPPGAHMEMNVWTQFVSKVSTGREPITKAHNDKDADWCTDYIVDQWGDISDERPAMIRTGDSLQLMQELPNDSIDFILTDPPYGGVIQYGELEFTRGSWLEDDRKAMITAIEENEIIVNNRQIKTDDDFYTSLRQMFQQCARVLKPNRHMVLTFTHTQLGIRNQIYRAAALSGLQVERVVWQEGARATQRATWQEGIALEGDYYIRFVNRFDATIDDGNIAEIDTQTYERHIRNVVIETIVENGMPTPLNSLLSRVEGRVTEILMERGVLPPLESRDLEEIIADDERICETDVGYWLANPRAFRFEIPLDRRIADLIIMAITREGGSANFTFIHRYIMQAIRDDLTPTRHDITDLLDELCETDDDGNYSIRPAIAELERRHEQMVYYLGRIAEMIQGRGPAIAIDELGKMYQGARLDAQLNLMDHPANYGARERNAIIRIDVLWMNKDSRITHCFEVENSTRIEGGIMRMSNVREFEVSGRQVRRVIVIPDDRLEEARQIANSQVLESWLTATSHYLLRYSALEEYFNQINDDNPASLAGLDDILEDMRPQARLDDFGTEEE